MSEYEYDLLVIGSGPAGQRAAIQAAKLDRRVAVVERKESVGGVSVNVGTIPSKTLREAVIYLSGYRERGLYGESYMVKKDIKLQDLLLRTNHVIRNEIDVTLSQLMRNRVELLTAEASFMAPHTVHLNYPNGRGQREITADKVVIATGTSSTRDENVSIAGKRVFTSDEILDLDELPRTLAVVGAGVIGCEYASIFATLGVRVTLIDKYPRLLNFVDSEIVDALVYHLRRNRVIFRLAEEVTQIEPTNAFRPRYPISTPWATWSAFPVWRPLPWSRAAWRPATPLTLKPIFCRSSFPMGFTPFLKFPPSAATKRT